LPAPATFDPRNFAADFHRTSRTRRPPAPGQMCRDGDKGIDGGRQAGRAANITNSTPLVCIVVRASNGTQTAAKRAAAAEKCLR